MGIPHTCQAATTARHRPRPGTRGVLIDVQVDRDTPLIASACSRSALAGMGLLTRAGLRLGYQAMSVDLQDVQGPDTDQTAPSAGLGFDAAGLLQSCRRRSLVEAPRGTTVVQQFEERLGRKRL